jgi:antitoxin component of RelBE/YafQ-DinJ toxin-antitoxin module
VFSRRTPPGKQATTATTVIHATVDADAKRRADETLAAHGFDAATTVRLFLAQTAHVGARLFATDQQHHHNPLTWAAIHEAEAVAAGDEPTDAYHTSRAHRRAVGPWPPPVAARHARPRGGPQASTPLMAAASLSVTDRL